MVLGEAEKASAHLATGSGSRPAGGPATAERERWIRALHGQNDVLDLVAKGVGIEISMSRLALVLESLFAPAICSISLIDSLGKDLRLIAAPSLPEAYKRAIESVAIAPQAGPCAAAAQRREPVVIPDLAADSRWADFHDLAAPFGFRSYWAQPILDRDGESLGTIALLYREAHSPDRDDERILDAVCPLARIAVEHYQRGRALEVADERFASLAANIPGVVYQRVVRPDGDIRYNYISEGARDLFGVAPAEILNDPKALFDCHGPDYRETFKERIMTASRQLTTWDVEASIISRDGQHKWTHAIARPQRQPDGSVIWNGVILDATRIKQANIELAASNRAKSEFIANMSHELRTPLNAIIGFSELITRGAAGAPEGAKFASYASHINESGKRLLDVINDILDLAKIESNRMELSEDITDLQQIIEKSVALMRDKAEAHNIAVTTKIAKDLPRLLGDQRKLKQIFINLLSNAVKFTPDGGKVVITARLEKKNAIAVTMTDSGIGIPEEDLSKVFDPFVQVDRGLDRRFEGTGLGLPLTKAMVELHGGTIDLQSRVDEGTTVLIRFPLNRVKGRG